MTIFMHVIVRTGGQGKLTLLQCDHGSLSALKPTGCSNHYAPTHIYIHIFTNLPQFHTLEMIEELEDRFYTTVHSMMMGQ